MVLKASEIREQLDLKPGEAVPSIRGLCELLGVEVHAFWTERQGNITLTTRDKNQVTFPVGNGHCAHRVGIVEHIPGLLGLDLKGDVMDFVLGLMTPPKGLMLQGESRTCYSYGPRWVQDTFGVTAEVARLAAAKTYFPDNHRAVEAMTARPYPLHSGVKTRYEEDDLLILIPNPVDEAEEREKWEWVFGC